MEDHRLGARRKSQLSGTRRAIFTSFVLLTMVLGCGSNPSSPSTEAAKATAQTRGAVEPRPAKDVDSRQPALAAQPTEVNSAEAESFQVERVQSLIESGNFDLAEAMLRSHLVVYPDNPMAIFTMAQLLAAQGDLESAIQTLRQPPIQESHAALPALGTTAGWLLQLGQPEAAADCYRQMLRSVPNAVMVHRSLSDLMLRMGRPSLARDSLRQMCRSGDIRQPELASLISVAQAAIDLPIGPVAQARRLAQQHNYQGAADLLEQRSKLKYQAPDIEAFHTRMLAEAQQDDIVATRLANGLPAQRQYSDYWAAQGIYSLRQGNFDAAIAALSQAIAIDQTDTSSIQRLSQAYRITGDIEAADQRHQLFRRVLKSVRLSNQIADTAPSIATIEELADVLDSLHRPLEAVLWRSIATSFQSDSTERKKSLHDQFARLANSENAFPPTATSVTLGNLAVPNRGDKPRAPGQPISAADSQAPFPPPPATAAWQNVAAEVGLIHEYRVARDPQSRAYAIYQSLGGGVAAIDYDLDGRCDLYFAQGAADPPEFRSEQLNPLYRNVGKKVVDVSRSAGTGENSYTMGVTAGDWNQDGFEDLAVNQFGSIVLLTNNTDGTFRRDVLLSKPTTRMPTSIAIADVNADGWQDLIALAYADSETIWEKPPVDLQGRPTYLIGPASFSGASNLVLMGSSVGWGTNFTEIGLPGEDLVDTSLGLIVGLSRPDEDVQDSIARTSDSVAKTQLNSIFIGNDQQNDRLWTHSNASPEGWTETAMLHGCAFGSFGNPSASMGIAAADFNQDGNVDLHITNFQDEPSSLFYGSDTGFRDQTIASGMHQQSSNVLGFGTAAVDFDFNGTPDLLVTNGYIDDPASMDAPFAQPMQLLVRRNNRYQLQAVKDPSGYWSKPHVGRAMARLDFDGDGRDDITTTHLNEPAAVLLNRTDTPLSWIRLALVGTDSPRNAVGADISVYTAERTLVHRLTAGDGYLCRDQPAITIGLGTHATDVDIRVRWPSGSIQDWKEVKANRQWVLTELATKPFETGIPNK